MKTFFLLSAFLLFAGTAAAQTDTLAYDGIANWIDPPLLAATDFPIEVNVVYTATFTPAQKCTLKGLVLGCGVVKFANMSEDDTLVVTLYDDTSIPLKNVFHTWYFDLGNKGFPAPNIANGNPLYETWRDLMPLQLNPAPVIAPARDFTLGIRLKTRQSYQVGTGYFHGLTLIFQSDAPNYERYHRYQKFADGKSAYPYVGPSSRYALYMRAVVQYDASLKDVDLTPAEALPRANAPALAQNYPNPFAGSTAISYTVPAAGYGSLTVHDMLGREVAVLAEGAMQPGTRTVNFDATGRGLPPGMYIVRLRMGGQVLTRNMILMK